MSRFSSPLLCLLLVSLVPWSEPTWSKFFTGSSPFFPGLFLRTPSVFPEKVTRSEFNSIQNQVQQLQQLLQDVLQQIRDLQMIVRNIRPKCPDLATGAKVIGNLCFSVETTPQPFDAARDMCLLKGGRLAEPLTTDSGFLSRLRSQFPVQFNGATSNFYLGIAVPDMPVGAPFQYLSNGLTISNTDPRWQTTPTPAVNKAAALVVSGTMWNLVEVANRNTETRPYICQYDTVL